jgi:hypothetical protein
VSAHPFSSPNLPRALPGLLFFSGTDLYAAHLEGADLRRAHLEETDLREAHLEGAILQDTIGKRQDQTAEWGRAPSWLAAMQAGLRRSRESRCRPPCMIRAGSMGTCNACLEAPLSMFGSSARGSAPRGCAWCSFGRLIHAGAGLRAKSRTTSRQTQTAALTTRRRSTPLSVSPKRICGIAIVAGCCCHRFDWRFFRQAPAIPCVALRPLRRAQTGDAASIHQCYRRGAFAARYGATLS